MLWCTEEDTHHPTLTVAQTLKFALETKTPRRRLPDESQRKFRDEVLALLLRMLNIEHTRDTRASHSSICSSGAAQAEAICSSTVVGNAWVRGVSGGERKRVSIAEMMTTRACVLSWDNSTRGLDASTALDYARSLRIVTDIFKTSMFVSLYQAGEGIFEQFDKVLLIDQGRQVFFGPAAEARPYLISLGYKDLRRQTSADYLTGCTDENERQFADGIDEEKVPKTPEELEAAYKESDVYRRMMKEREEWQEYERRELKWREEFRRAVAEDKGRGVGKKSPYTVSFLSQVWALTFRQARIKMQDRVGFSMGYITSIITALIAGSCYLNLPLTAAGAFTRGGVLFTALLFNSFNAFNELPVQMLGRPIMWKQSGFTFYRPGAYTLAATLADLPFQFIQIVIFCIIVSPVCFLKSKGEVGSIRSLAVLYDWPCSNGRRLLHLPCHRLHGLPVARFLLQAARMRLVRLQHRCPSRRFARHGNGHLLRLHHSGL